ncbi:MAG: alpha/beta family hydrolase [Pseudomonadota bacterium]|nr:alpha/beta family hydrolase [Pseudomonadota bacterium]
MHIIRDGSDQAAAVLILAHGAGAGSDSEFMEWFAYSLTDPELAGELVVCRFDFPYMIARRATGIKRPPDRAGVLIKTWHQAINLVRRSSAPPHRLFIGGKSMGGRFASMVAENEKVDGIVCLGYPFHPPGKPDKLRTEHLEDLNIPMLVCQGERDVFGKKVESANWQLSGSIQFSWLTDGDHSFKPRKKSGLTEADNRTSACQSIIEFIANVQR